jgi:hypothetical protein
VLNDWRLDPRLRHEGHLSVGGAEWFRRPGADLVEVLLLLCGAIYQPEGEGKEKVRGVIPVCPVGEEVPGEDDGLDDPEHHAAERYHGRQGPGASRLH